MKRVVITGTGIYSTIGKNLDEVRDSLYNGRSGIGLDPAREALGYRSRLTGIIESPDLKGLLDRRSRVGLPEQGKYAYIATLEALENAGIDQDYLDKSEAGILYGNDSSSVPVIEAIDMMRQKKDTTLLGSGSIFQSMNSTLSMNLSVIFKLKGINFTVSGACASGSCCVGAILNLTGSIPRRCFRFIKSAFHRVFIEKTIAFSPAENSIFLSASAYFSMAFSGFDFIINSMASFRFPSDSASHDF